MRIKGAWWYGVLYAADLKKRFPCVVDSASDLAKASQINLQFP